MTKNVRILLVEDSETDAILTRESLIEAGFDDNKVTHVSSARDAEKMVATGTFDIVLLDLGLPDSTGHGSIKRVMNAAQHPAPSVVILTGIDDETAGVEAMKLGCQDFVSKNDAGPVQLRRAIRYALERTKAELAVQESERRYRTLIEMSPEAVMVCTCDSNSGIVYANLKAASLFGMDSADDIKGMRYVDFFADSQEKRRAQEEISQVRNAKGTKTNEAKRVVMCTDGKLRHIEETTNYIELDGKPAVQICVRDVTDKHELERKSRLALEVFKATSEAMAIMDKGFYVISVNPAFTKVTGFLPEEVVGSIPAPLLSRHHQKIFFDAMWDSLARHGKWEGEILGDRKDGQSATYKVSMTAIKQCDVMEHYIAVFHDVTQIKRLESSAAMAAMSDPLTGLANRSGFVSQLEQMIDAARRDSGEVVVGILDVAEFKRMNFEKGHRFCDHLLAALAARLLSAMPRQSAVARLGGDEFAFAFRSESLSDPQNAVGAIAREVSEPLMVGGKEIAIRCRLGSSVYPENAVDVDSLLEKADNACYLCKANGVDFLMSSVDLTR